MTEAAKPGDWAIFSDVHGNLEALEAVLKDIESQKVDHLLCLGDIVSYGADSPACVEKIRALGCPCLMGNHDQASVHIELLDEFTPLARSGLRLSNSQLNDSQKAFLESLPFVFKGEAFEAVHASLFRPKGWNYVLDLLDAEMHFEEQDMPLCFCAHSHRPGIWEKMPKEIVQHAATDLVLKAGTQYLVNVGAVGQPRDRHPEACYVVYRAEEKKIIFRRVMYDISQAQKKILEAGLPSFLAERLGQGI